MVAEMQQTAGTITQHCSNQQQENVPVANLQRPKLEEECLPESSSSMMENGSNINIIGQINSQFDIEENKFKQDETGNIAAGTEDGMKTENLVSSNLELFLCTNCGLPIHDRFLYQVLDQQFYHEKCLHCSVCSEPFATVGSCFSRNQLLFCRDHFFATFGPKCARCSAPIGERTIVRRANQHIYHLDCFQCIVCKRELNTGDQFYLIPMDGRLVCRQDFENAQKESAEMDCGNKRPRTTISAKSLETLKQAYQCSSKPARHVREQLATQTGLDMRVVQVWFQNRRAKEKRLKKDANRRWAAQQANGGGGGGDGRSGSNGTATGGNGSGPGSVPSSSGMHGIMFGRAGTLDSDSGASNNDAESPIYSIYTNPSDVDVDVNSSNDLIYPDQNGGIFLATSDASSAPGQSQQQPQGMAGQQQSGQGQGGMSAALMSGIQRQHSDQQQMSSPHHQQQQQTPPIPSHQPQSHPPPPQLYTLEQLEAGVQMGGGNGGAAIMDPRTPIAQSNAQIAILSSAGIGGPSSQHSQPGTPQQQQMPQNGPIFSPHQMICAADLMNEANGGTGAQNGSGTLLSDQQQQYLLAAAFGPPPPQMPQMGQFMMSPQAPESAFYHPSMGHPPLNGHQMAAMEANGQPPPIIGHPLGPHSHPHFSPLSMQIMHSGHHYHQNGQQISQ